MRDLISANALFVKGEYEEAAKCYLELAWSGDLNAMFNMGYLYQFGIGVQADLEKAADFYAVALYLDGGEAAYNLAVMTMNGIGVKRDIKKAVQYMETSANCGCPEAQFYLASACAFGYAGNPVYSNICKIPYHKAEQRYDFAVLDGYIDEEEEAKIEEERRCAVAESFIDAHRWVSLVAQCPDEDDVYGDVIKDAKFMLGYFNMEGIGCRINRKKGQKLITEAALAGSVIAQQYLLNEKNSEQE